ncbi:hypothetical protein Tco_0594385, partial [Tanacetum coccineum]
DKNDDDENAQDDEDDDKNDDDKNAQDDEDSDNEVDGMDVEGEKSDEDATYVEDQGNEADRDTDSWNSTHLYSNPNTDPNRMPLTKAKG